MSNTLFNVTFANQSSIGGLTSASGDLIIGGPSGNSISNLSVGSNGEVLTVVGGTPTWATAGSSVTLNDVSVTGDQTLVSGGTGPSLTVKKISAGMTGIDVTSDANQIFINNTSPASSVTLGSAGGTVSLVDTVGGGNTGPALSVNGLTAGTGIMLGLAAGAITIDCDQTLQESYDSSTNPELVLDGTRGALTIRDNSTPIGANLLEIQNNAASQTYFGVDATGAAIDGNLTITGDLTVSGTTTTVDTETLNVESNYICLNKNYDSDAAQRCGQVYNVNPEPAAGAKQTDVAATGFTAGVDTVSNPTVSTVDTSDFADGDIIIITGANNPTNNGIFEVLSHAANVLTIRGIGTTGNTSGIDFVQDQFATDTTVAGTITQTDLTVQRARTDGQIEIGSGATAATLNASFKTIITEIDSAGGVSLVSGTGLGPTASTKGLTAGTGISFMDDGNSITITNSSSGADVTLSSAGGTVSLVDTVSGGNTGPALSVNGLTAGTGIMLGLAGGAITIDNTLDTFVELTDTPANYTSSDNKMLVVNGTPDAVVFSENRVGTNTETTGTSVALGGSSSVAANASAIAIGNTATVTAARSAALGTSASCNTTDCLTTAMLPMVNNTSATATALTASVYPGTNVVIATDVINLEDAGATVTIDLPPNTRMLVDRIDVMKLDAAATATTTAATYTVGVTGTNDAYVTTQTLNDTDSVNAQYERASFSSFPRTAATDSLTFTHTLGNYTGSWTVRVFFEGKLIRDE